MDNKFFFITTYDNISGQLVASLLNIHPDINCVQSQNDPFIDKLPANKDALDVFIESNLSSSKRFNGNIQEFSAYELQNKILLEKTKQSLRKINLTVSPKQRINFLMNNWLVAYHDAGPAIMEIEKKLHYLSQSQHPLIGHHRFNYFLQLIKTQASADKVDVDNSFNKLFFLALAKIITLDTADLPTSGRNTSLESLISDEQYFVDFVRYISCNQISLDFELIATLKPQLVKANHFYNKIQDQSWEQWQINLLDKFLNLRLQTIYHPHIDKPLATFYKDLGYKLAFLKNTNENSYTKLISIQLNSNRPAQLSIYFDNIEETADDLNQIEVVINIDDHDHAMETMLKHEISHRKFTIKYITTPKPKSFCDLWKPINKLLDITDPKAYFLLNISDEMLFADKGWDTVLKKYIGFFPDHIFRLRASRNKFRNYFDRWECSFGQDSIPITTKKWIDIGGDWNPCFGPDSFQQLISFYLAKEGLFSGMNYLRELPLIDIKFHGDIPSLGMDPEKSWKHNRDHIFAMQICQSHKMQLEARKRAILLKANILASAQQLKNFDCIDDKQKRVIRLIDLDHNKIICELDYNLNWLPIWLSNQMRKTRFYAYFGAGKEYSGNHIRGFASYLKAKYQLANQFHLYIYKIRSMIRIRTVLFKVCNPFLKYRKLLTQKPSVTLKKIHNKISKRISFK